MSNHPIIHMNKDEGEKMIKYMAVMGFDAISQYSASELAECIVARKSKGMGGNNDKSMLTELINTTQSGEIIDTPSLRVYTVGRNIGSPVTHYRFRLHKIEE